MRPKFALMAALFSLSLMVSACHDGRPGHDSDRHRGGYDHGDRHD